MPYQRHLKYYIYILEQIQFVRINYSKYYGLYWQLSFKKLIIFIKIIKFSQYPCCRLTSTLLTNSPLQTNSISLDLSNFELSPKSKANTLRISLCYLDGQVPCEVVFDQVIVKGALLILHFESLFPFNEVKEVKYSVILMKDQQVLERFEQNEPVFALPSLKLSIKVTETYKVQPNVLALKNIQFLKNNNEKILNGSKLFLFYPEYCLTQTINNEQSVLTANQFILVLETPFDSAFAVVDVKPTGGDVFSEIQLKFNSYGSELYELLQQNTLKENEKKEIESALKAAQSMKLIAVAELFGPKNISEDRAEKLRKQIDEIPSGIKQILKSRKMKMTSKAFTAKISFTARCFKTTNNSELVREWGEAVQNSKISQEIIDKILVRPGDLLLHPKKDSFNKCKNPLSFVTQPQNIYFTAEVDSTDSVQVSQNPVCYFATKTDCEAFDLVPLTVSKAGDKFKIYVYENGEVQKIQEVIIADLRSKLILEVEGVEFNVQFTGAEKNDKCYERVAEKSEVMEKEKLIEKDEKKTENEQEKQDIDKDNINFSNLANQVEANIQQDVVIKETVEIENKENDEVLKQENKTDQKDVQNEFDADEQKNLNLCKQSMNFPKKPGDQDASVSVIPESEHKIDENGKKAEAKTEDNVQVAPNKIEQEPSINNKQPDTIDNQKQVTAAEKIEVTMQETQQSKAISGATTQQNLCNGQADISQMQIEKQSPKPKQDENNVILCQIDKQPSRQLDDSRQQQQIINQLKQPVKIQTQIQSNTQLPQYSKEDALDPKKLNELIDLELKIEHNQGGKFMVDEKYLEKVSELVEQIEKMIALESRVQDLEEEEKQQVGELQFLIDDLQE